MRDQRIIDGKLTEDELRTVVRRIGFELCRYLLDEHTDNMAPFSWTPLDIAALLKEKNLENQK
jgi:hypothetical protein